MSRQEADQQSQEVSLIAGKGELLEEEFDAHHKAINEHIDNMITRLEEKDDVKKEIRRKTLTNFITKTIDPDKSNTSDLSPDRPVLPMGFHGIKLRRKSSALKV